MESLYVLCFETAFLIRPFEHGHFSLEFTVLLFEALDHQGRIKTLVLLGRVTNHGYSLGELQGTDSFIHISFFS